MQLTAQIKTNSESELSSICIKHKTVKILFYDDDDDNNNNNLK